MQIIGHKLIKFTPFIFVKDANEAKENDNIIFRYDEEILKICSDLNKNFSVIVSNEIELMIVTNLEANYAIVDESLIKLASELVNYYVLDTKVAAIIEDDKEIKKYLNFKTDAVIYKNSIINF